MTYLVPLRNLMSAAMMFCLSVEQSTAQDAMSLQVKPSHEQSEGIGFDIEALDALPQLEFLTTTIWTDGMVEFSGVSLKALLENVDATGATLEMVALNDYAVTIPISEIEDASPMIATRMNGKQMSVREKGPFWIVFPYDSDPKYQSELVYSRSIWQLSRLNVLE